MTRFHPALFVPHGAPTFALQPGAAGMAMAEAARALPKPRAIIIVSAHWLTEAPTVGVAARLQTVHDFAGFPDALYAIRYPATGCPEAANEVIDVLTSAGLPAQRDAAHGLDHGAWIPLRLMFPDADVPVIPLSLQPRGGPEQAYRLGRALAPLTSRGFLVVASGNLTHNLRDYMLAAMRSRETPAYVHEFSDWVAQRLASGDVEGLLNYRQRAPGAMQAHPTDEHLLPLYVALGAGGDNAQVRRIHAGIDDYVLSMDAFAFQAQKRGSSTG